MKRVAFLLAALLVLAWGLPTLAQQEDAVSTVPFAYTLFEVEGVPYAYGMPQDWPQVELTQDERAWGQIGKFQNPAGDAVALVTLEELDLKDYPAGLTLDELAALMKGWKGYRDVERVDIGQIPFISYAQPKEKSTGLMAMLQSGEGDVLILHFDFVFESPDEGTAEISRQIAGLLREK